MSESLRELIRDVRAWEVKHGFYDATTLTEQLKADDRYAAELQESPIFAGQAITTILMESLPKSAPKRKDVPDDIHARVVAAFSGERLLGAKPLAEVMDLDEAPKDAKVVVSIPEDGSLHRKLAFSR